MHQLRIDISWQNSNKFEVNIKPDGERNLTLIHSNENGHITALWPAITDQFERYIKALMYEIGVEMAKPPDQGV